MSAARKMPISKSVLQRSTTISDTPGPVITAPLNVSAGVQQAQDGRGECRDQGGEGQRQVAVDLLAAARPPSRAAAAPGTAGRSAPRRGWPSGSRSQPQRQRLATADAPAVVAAASAEPPRAALALPSRGRRFWEAVVFSSWHEAPKVQAEDHELPIYAFWRRDGPSSSRLPVIRSNRQLTSPQRPRTVPGQQTSHDQHPPL